MNSKKVVLAYLANRFLGAMGERAILQTVNRCGLLDKPLTADELLADLQWLANPKQAWVELTIDKESGVALWNATDEGMKRWNLDGRLAV